MNYGKLGNGLWLQEIKIRGILKCFSIYNKEVTDGDVSVVPVCYALGTDIADQFTLWHIHTQPEDRRKGYAKKLIETLQNHYSSIVTGVNALEGDALCKACGFKEFESMLIWDKQNERTENGKEKITS